VDDIVTLGGGIMHRTLHFGIALYLAALALPGSGWAQKAPPAPSVTHTPAWFKAAVSEKWTGDLDGMVKRRVIRALVVYSQTYYFLDRGTQRGVTYDSLAIFEDELNKALKAKKLRVTVVFIPVHRGDLIPALIDGRGDIAASGVTMTTARDKLIDFSMPIAEPINEIVVSGPESPNLGSVGDLSGREVYVRKSSSYYEHLQTLNGELAKAGKPPVRLRLAPETLEDEDLLQMLNAGLVQFVVADDMKMQLWKQVLPNITVHPDLVVNAGGAYAWMFREKSPQLQQAINAFVKRHPRGNATRNELLRRYLKSTKYVKNSTSPQELQKFGATIDLFRKYGDKYSFDALLMTAQGYQESRLDQRVRSPVGAVGVMQVMPQTGRAMQVGDIAKIDPNVHAGVKYIALIRDKYFANMPMDELNKALFAFAAYNAGPSRIKSLRPLAEKRGLDPNVWFDNVEIVAADKIGRETVTYVRNVYKYYISYRLVLDRKKERDEAINTVAGKQS
jgi:membrane-bound lytic murein transglycosylase MltF